MPIFKRGDLKKETLWPFLWLGFNCLKNTEPLQGSSLLFTTESAGLSGTNFIDLGTIKA